MVLGVPILKHFRVDLFFFSLVSIHAKQGNCSDLTYLFGYKEGGGVSLPK